MSYRQSRSESVRVALELARIGESRHRRRRAGIFDYPIAETPISLFLGRLSLAVSAAFLAIFLGTCLGLDLSPCNAMQPVYRTVATGEYTTIYTSETRTHLQESKRGIHVVEEWENAPTVEAVTTQELAGFVRTPSLGSVACSVVGLVLGIAGLVVGLCSSRLSRFSMLGVGASFLGIAGYLGQWAFHSHFG